MEFKFLPHTHWTIINEPWVEGMVPLLSSLCLTVELFPVNIYNSFVLRDSEVFSLPLNSSQASSACFLSLLASSSSILLARALRFLLRPCLTLSVSMWNGPMPILGGSVCSSIFCCTRWYSTSSFIFCAGSFLDSYSLENKSIQLNFFKIVSSHLQWNEK